MDWIFGTLYLPKQWPSAYGIETKLPDSLGRQLVYPILPQPPVSSLPAVSADTRTQEHSTLANST
jgi:hypothetical protein